MINEILTPLDGTKVAETTVLWAREAAARLNSTVKLLHIIAEDEISPSQRDSAHDYLRYHRQALVDSGVRADMEIAGGRPAEAIIERANRTNLTVMTSGTVRWMVSAVARPDSSGSPDTRRDRPGRR